MKNASIIGLVLTVVYMLYMRPKQQMSAFEAGWYHGQETALKDINAAEARHERVRDWTPITQDSIEFKQLVSWP